MYSQARSNEWIDPNTIPELRRARPYRSKRLRPCDICRQRKHACQLQDEPPCVSCRNLGVACTFNNPPSKRAQRDHPSIFQEVEQHTMIQDLLSLQESSLPEFSDLGTDIDIFRDIQLPQLSHQGLLRATPPPVAQTMLFNASENEFAGERQQNPRASQVSLPTAVTPFAAGTIDPFPPRSFSSIFPGEGTCRAPITDSIPAATRHLSAQAVVSAASQPKQSLDEAAGYSVQYSGLSGEMDPYLLRHFKFPDAGTTKFFKVHYRQLAPETPSDIPVHFRLTSHDIADSSTPETSIRALSSGRELLENLVPVQVGVRLVGLFFRYVFPSLPVLSRTAFGLSRDTLIPDSHVLREIPSHLLAAVYASSHVFARHDPVLCVSSTYQNLPAEKLWRLAYEGIHDDIHRAQLATLQTALLYLQKQPLEGVTALADTPFHRSWISLLACLATTLGLNLDCRCWPIPLWERRLRRRLWWAVYTETTWHSLLMGIPHPIGDDEWDVSPLDESDFVIDHLVLPNLESYNISSASRSPCVYCHKGHEFVSLASLTVIAYDTYRNLYTLRATRKLAKDLGASLDVSKPLFEKLSHWEDSLPPQLKVDASFRPPDKCYFHLSSAAYLRVAYLTLNVYIHRALMRPLGCVATAAAASPDINPPSRRESSSTGNSISTHTRLQDTTESIRIAGVGCAKRILELTRKLDSLDRISFWSSWSWMCFPSISTFIVLLLIQSPTTESANESKYLLDMWSQTLRLQTAVFAQMRMGLLRLDTMNYFGLERLFHCPPFISEVLREPIDGFPVSPPTPE